MKSIIKSIGFFILGVYIGTEIQAWWSREGCEKWMERKKQN